MVTYTIRSSRRDSPCAVSEYKVTDKGTVYPASSIESEWRINKRVSERASNPPERVEFGMECKRSEAKNGAKPLILGYKTYLSEAVEYHEGGHVADLGRNPMHRYRRKRLKQGKRGKVTSFSAASQRRLMYLVASVERGQPCHFTTLTFPISKISAKDAKGYLKAWWKRLERKFAKCGRRIGCIWKMEPHKSGDWHFHLMIFGVKFLPLQWAKWAWQDVLGGGDIKGAYHRGVHVKHVDGNMDALKAYICKYFTKDSPGDYLGEDIGRIWGNRGELPINPKKAIGLTVKELVWVWRLHSRKAKRNIMKLSPMLFSNSPPEWFANAKVIAGSASSIRRIKAGFRHISDFEKVGYGGAFDAQIKRQKKRAKEMEENAKL